MMPLKKILKGVLLVALIVVIARQTITIKNYDFREVAATKGGVEVTVRMIGKEQTTEKTTRIGSPYQLIVGIRPTHIGPFKAKIKEITITDKKQRKLYNNNTETTEEGTKFSDGTVNAVFDISPVNLVYVDHRTCIKYKILNESSVDDDVCLEIQKNYSERRSLKFWKIMSGV